MEDFTLMKLRAFMQRLEALIEEMGYDPDAEIIIVPDRGGIGYDDVTEVGFLVPIGRGIFIKSKMGDPELF
jgi:hypothetical protein